MYNYMRQFFYKQEILKRDEGRHKVPPLQLAISDLLQPTKN